jgi:hypothetical protein
MKQQANLVEAAIRFDEQALVSSEDPGALHFLGMLKLDQRHVRFRSEANSRLPEQMRRADRIEVDESSVLFMAAEAVRNVMVGKSADAESILSSLESTKGIDRVLVLLVKAWLYPSVDALEAVDRYTTSVKKLSDDVVSRVYLKLMTWALDVSGKTDSASEYYDRALKAAPSELKRAIYGVGRVFNRETRYFYSPVEDRLVTYPSIIDSVAGAAAEGVFRQAKNRLSPFSRSFGADPRTLSEPVRAAELQAGWIGAYWVLAYVWRIKSSILLVNSHDREEIASAITAWVLSSGPDLSRLISENENVLTEDIISKILVENLKSGARVQFDDWVDICLPIWDELPAAISSDFISSVEIKAWNLKDILPRQQDNAITLFNALSRVDQAGWVERFKALRSRRRLTVCLGLSADQVAVMPRGVKNGVRSSLLEYLGQLREYSAEPQSYLTLASLVRELGDDSAERSKFFELLPAEYAADVAISFPSLTSHELIRADLLSSTTRIREQIARNLQGTWVTFARRPAGSAARAMIALQESNEDTIKALLDFATSEYSSADDILDSIGALSWLADENLLPSFELVESRLGYRLSVSPVDQYWRGRDDLRLINAAIAGLFAQNVVRNRDAVVRLIAATRDPDTQVRLLAINQLKKHIPERGLFPSVDAAVLGAIYDPDSRVQAEAIDGISVIADPLVNEIAWTRVVSVWDTAHKRVRLAAARNAVEPPPSADVSADLRGEVVRLASEDRSLLVRAVVSAELGSRR